MTAYRDDSLEDDSEQKAFIATDVEKGQASEPALLQASPQHHEDTVSTNKKLWYLAGYFICNIGLTLYNKAILGSVSHPPLPQHPAPVAVEAKNPSPLSPQRGLFLILGLLVPLSLAIDSTSRRLLVDRMWYHAAARLL